MQRVEGRLLFSATDLVGHLECGHFTELEGTAAFGLRERPIREDPVLDRIAKRGTQHETRLLEELRADGFAVTTIVVDEKLPYHERLATGRDETRSAMAAGADVIYQAVLFDEIRFGYADFLRRVSKPSDFGEWSYEVWDAKLARHATAAAVLQLCMYSHMVEELQGCPPDAMHLALGGVAQQKVSFRFADFAAYYRLADRKMQDFLGDFLGDRDDAALLTKPEPVEHCGVCRWSLECRQQWRAADDLSLVANLTSRQRRTLTAVGVTTRRDLAGFDKLPAEPLDGISDRAMANIRAQAAIQVKGDDFKEEVISERIEPPLDAHGALVANHGLLMLPEPSRGDLFFDIEGDPFYGSDTVDGIDYLFGVVEPGAAPEGEPVFHDFWSIDDEGTVTTASEKRAFEEFIDLAIERLESDPDLHIYHYAPYEPTAVKRLAGRHGTREEEVDRLLRGEVFVDLYRAVRQGIRASVESYSIKRLEPLYSFRREAGMRDASSSIVEFETWLELGEGEARSDLLNSIKGYNRDDCLSTMYLRDWLESQRDKLSERHGDLPRPSVPEPEDTEDSEAQQRVNQLAADLCAGLPANVEEEGGAAYGRWLLAQLLNWHRREDKSCWWRYFHLAEKDDEERLSESDAMSGLRFSGSTPNPAPRARSMLHRFKFPPQEHSIKEGTSPHDPETLKSVGTVHRIDEQAGEIVIKLGTERPAPTGVTSLIPLDLVNPKPKPQSLEHIARWVLDHGIEGDGAHQAARDLLSRRPPRLGQAPEQPLCGPGEDALHAARRLVANLDHTYLAIQGPPGSGKSTVGAAMIVDLVAEGRTVGVTANSHKVIGEMLLKVAKSGAGRGIRVRVGQRTGGEPASARFTHLKSTPKALAALADGSVDVVGATTWLWARDDMAGSVDVLFIDEAGQMSLADAVAASPCAESLVLLGDPQQLDQPLTGVHPPGSERSVLAHLLDDHRVMPDHLGLFLDHTWRLHPAICEYTSEVFYEGRLQPHPGRDNLSLAGAGPLDGAGLLHVAAVHDGCSNLSSEEVVQVSGLISDLMSVNAAFTDADGNTRSVDESDVLIVAPYNAQVRALIEALPRCRVGTVDKFQGQEAPVSIYSMATSSAEEAPRGMEFLYSLNRLNVATSRAQCVAVLVANSGLINARCRTPRQMRLASALARFMEMAFLSLGGDDRGTEHEDPVSVLARR